MSGEGQSTFVMVPAKDFAEMNDLLRRLVEHRQPAPSGKSEQFFERLLDDPSAVGFDPMRAYTAQEVADLLSVHVNSVYLIPEDELPRVRRINKDYGYLGINVLCYMHRRPPIDLERSIEDYRSRILNDRPVRPLNPELQEKTRVL